MARQSASQSGSGDESEVAKLKQQLATLQIHHAQLQHKLEKEGANPKPEDPNAEPPAAKSEPKKHAPAEPAVDPSMEDTLVIPPTQPSPEVEDGDEAGSELEDEEEDEEDDDAATRVFEPQDMAMARQRAELAEAARKEKLVKDEAARKAVEADIREEDEEEEMDEEEEEEEAEETAAILAPIPSAKVEEEVAIDSDAEDEAAELARDEEEARVALIRAEEAKRRLEALKAKTANPKPSGSSEPASHSTTTTDKLGQALSQLRRMKEAKFEGFSDTSSTRTPDQEAFAALNALADQTQDEALTINTSTHKKAWAKLDRLMSGPRGSDFPHMRQLFAGKQSDASLY